MSKLIRSHRSVVAAVCAALIFSFVLCVAPSGAWAASSTVVISQVYGGGGNSGATYKNDFIELYNRGTTTVNLSGWSVQYASAAGTTWTNITPLSGSIAPGQYYLIKEAAGASGTVDLPSPSATGSIALSATAGKVALVSSTTALSGACPKSDASVVDFVGFGTTASCFEGTGPTPAPSNTNAVLRAAGGATDTDNNAADFTTGPPVPRIGGFSASGSVEPAPAGQGEPVLLKVLVVPGATPPSTGLSVVANLSTIGGPSSQALFDDGTHGDLTANDNTFSFAVTIDAATPLGAVNIPVTVGDAQLRSAAATISFTVIGPVPLLAIHDLQGSGAISPYANQLVRTTGIVTAKKTNGFFIQTADSLVDAAPSTSEGVFVYTSSAPPVAAALGNLVQVRGTVQEYIPSADLQSPSTTEVISPTVTVLDTGKPLPAAVSLTAADLDPAGSMTQLQKYEGMRVHVDSLNVIAPTQGSINEPNATSTSNGVFYGVFPGVPRPHLEEGILAPGVPPAGSPSGVPRFDGNPERLRVDSDGQVGAARIDVATGAAVSNLTGVLEYTYRSFSLLPDPSTPPSVTGGITVAPVPAPGEHEVTIASANLERFFDTSNDSATSDPVLTATAFNNRLSKYSLAIRTIFLLPDILGVEEVENLPTLQALADRINSDVVNSGQPNPNYQAYLEEGNDIGGIDVGFLVKSSRIDVAAGGITQVGKDATYINPKTGLPEMLNDRPPLVLRAAVHVTGKELPLPLTVIVNHLRSLSGIDDDPLDGSGDGPRVRAKRLAQAQYLADLVQGEQAAHPDANIVSVGDYNATNVNDGYVDVMGAIIGSPAPPDQDVLAAPADLVNPHLVDLLMLISSPDQQYSYLYDGNTQVLDHILVNGKALTKVSRFGYARINADFPEIYRNDPTRPERYSDHDVPLAYFTVPQDTVAPALTLPADITVAAASPLGTLVTFSASADDNIDGPTAIACIPASGTTFAIGKTTVTCTSTDTHGNTATGTFNVSVNYVFSGFLPPLSAGGTAKAGSTIPVKWQLTYSTGSFVSSTAVVDGINAAYNADCAGVVLGPLFPAASPGASALRYDSNQFVLNWKTDKAWSGCYALLLKLNDGTTRTAIVNFK